MRRLLLSLAVVGTLVALPATALAAGPVRETAVFAFTDPAVFAACDGFEIIATSAHIRRETLTWYDATSMIRGKPAIARAGADAARFSSSNGALARARRPVADLHSLEVP